MWGAYTGENKEIYDAVRKLIVERRLSKEERNIVKDVLWDFLVKAVSNSGPIIHLSEVNCFDALQIADVERVYT